MFTELTEDENMLLEIFFDRSRINTINELSHALIYLGENEKAERELTSGLISKLEGMSEKELEKCIGKRQKEWKMF